jgi:hypothetical protein
MMPGIWVVLVPVTPFPAAIGPGELRTAERVDLLARCHSKRVVCHLRDPLRCCLAVYVAGRALPPSWWRPGSGM